MAVGHSVDETIDEAARRRFEQAWRSGQSPELGNFLPPVEAPAYLPTLEELVHIDLEFRWSRSENDVPASTERPLLEIYLARFPALRGGGILSRLVAQERHVRSRAGEPPLADEYARRFPGMISVKAEIDSPPPTNPTPNRNEQTLIGTARIPGYEILEVLGRGGIGVVYQARHVRLNRLVAIKMLLSGVHAGSEEKERFQREAEAVAKLHHPNIVPVYDVGEADGRLFIVFEFVAGGNLAQKMAATPLAANEAAELIATLADAIDHAHSHQIIHRDLKPTNVMITHDGVAKIGDFGLAKRLAADDGATRTGDVLGTPSYMAPEQASGRIHDIGPATDVYALGAILYECLTGRPPFRADTAWETVSQVLSLEPVAPSQLQPRLAADLETICLKCLEKDPAKRYASALELADELRRFLRHEPIVARPAGWMEKLWRWCARNSALATAGGIIALLLFITAGGGVAFGLYQQTVADDLLKANDRTKEEQKKTADALAQSNLAAAELLLDEALRNCTRGDVDLGLLRMAQAFDRAGPTGGDLRRLIRANLAIWGQQLPRLEDFFRLPSPAIASAITHDGNRLAIAYEGADRKVSLVLWDTTSGHAIGQPISLSAGLPQLTIPAAGETLWTVDGSGGVRSFSLSTAKENDNGFRLESPANVALVDPLGKMLVVVRPPIPPVVENITSLEVWSLSEKKRVGTKTLDGFGRAFFHPDGSLYITSFAGNPVLEAPENSQLYRFQLPDWKEVHAARPYRGTIFDFVASPDGSRYAIFFGGGATALFDAKSGQQLGISHTANSAPGNGNFLVPTLPGGLGGFNGIPAPPPIPIPVAKAGEPIQLPRSLRFALPQVIFSPDSRWLAAADGMRVLVVRTENGEMQASWDAHDDSVDSLAFSPDGRLLATGSLDGKVRLWDASTAEAKGRSFRIVGKGIPLKAETTARFNPDNTFIPLAPWLQGRLAFAGANPRLVAWGDGEVVEAWDVADSIASAGIELPHNGIVNQAFFQPRGERLMTLALLPTSNGTMPLIPPVPADRPLGPDLPLVPIAPDGAPIVPEKPANPLPETPLPGQPPAVPLEPPSPPPPPFTVPGKSGLFLWDLAGHPLGDPQIIEGTVTVAAMSAKGELAVGTDEGRVLRFNSEGKRMEPALKIDQPVVTLAWSRDGNILYASGAYGGPSRWDSAGKEIGDGPFLFERDGVPHAVGHLEADAKGDSLLVSSSFRGRVETWQIRGAQLEHRLLLEDDRVLPAGLSPDAQRVFADDSFYNFRDGKPVGSPIPHLFPVTAQAFAPDGLTIAVGSGVEGTAPHGEARLFRVATSEPLGPPLVHPSPVKKLEFDRAGKILLSQSGFNIAHNGAVRLCDTATGKPLGPDYRETGDTLCCALHAEGNLVVTGGQPNAVLELQVPASGVAGIAEAIATRQLKGLGNNPGVAWQGIAHLWRLPPPIALPDEAITPWVAAVTRRQLDTYGVPQLLDDANWRTMRNATK